MAATTRSYSGRATVGHDLRHRRDRPPAGDTAPAWTEAGSTHLHHPEQRDQAPGPLVLERALCPAPVATAPAAAVLIHLRRDKMALYRGQDRLALLQAEAQRRCGMPGWEALARADLVPLRRAVRPGQLQHDPPPHRAPAPQPPAAGIAPPQVLDGFHRPLHADCRSAVRRALGTLRAGCRRSKPMMRLSLSRWPTCTPSWSLGLIVD